MTIRWRSALWPGKNSLFHPIGNHYSKDIQGELDLLDISFYRQLDSGYIARTAMNCPLDVCSAVSVAHTGTIALRMPVPHPLTCRELSDLLFHLDNSSAHKSSDDHVGMVLSATLQGSTNNTPYRRQCNGPDTSNFLADETANETAHERSKVVDGYDATLSKRIGDDWGRNTIYNLSVADLDSRNVVGGIVHSPHHSPVGQHCSLVLSYWS
jgi:hypothetical protein